ncbi:Rap1a/Tai family immunity protein [Roseovarius sp. PS-C2]|uniref:Rap1a/Tai family immunity protein n=1 Tax=Roseovarius sp. PS-C2 TaxID=2820814 RepID=UPI001C0D02A3
MRWIAMIVAIWASPSGAQDGNFLLDICTKGATYSPDMCAGFVGGATGLIPYAPQFSSTVCLPTGVTYPQMTDVVIAYLQDNPAQRHNFASPLIAIALGEAFPCK